MVRMTLPKALLISLLWHMLCFFAFVIVVTPVTTGKEKFSKISFIGAILDSETFGYYKQKEGLDYPGKDYIPRQLITKDNDARISFNEERLRYAQLDSYATRPYINSIIEVIKEKKDLPSDIYLPIEKIDFAYDTGVRGEVGNRQVLFKPTTPVISMAFRIGKTPSKGEKYQIKLKFLVSPEGKIVFIEKMKSCGYPDIDLIAIRFMEKWQFAPLSPDRPKTNQEGIMLLELEAR